jgi:outer membrane immunogenic protein
LGRSRCLAGTQDASKTNEAKKEELENKMKKILLGTVALMTLGLAAPASAADLAARPYTKAPAPMMVAIYDWSGFYLGLNGGGGWSNKCWDLTNNLGVVVAPAFGEGCNNGSGAVAGGQIGYRWQASSWVFGLEAQGDWANIRGSNVSLFIPVGPNGPLPPGTNRSTVNGLGLFTGQVGYAMNSVLLYVKGGAAVTSDKYKGLVTATGVAFDGASETRWGGTVGAGVEFSFAQNWSAGVEYDHLFMGTRSLNFSAIPAGTFSRTDNIRQDVDMVTARINYRWGGPVVAKY